MEKTPSPIDFAVTARIESNDTYNAFLTLVGSKTALGTGNPVKVAGTLDGKAFHVTLMPSGKGDHWLPLRKELRVMLGKSAPGETVAVHLTERFS